MFGLFNKKESRIKIKDKVWATVGAKWKGCMEIFSSDPDTVFIAWFDESLEQLEEAFRKENLSSPNILMTRQAASHLLKNKNVVFIEHYPMRKKEQALFEQLNLTEVQIFSSLNEPIFKHFGSERIVDLMTQLGMKEEEVIQHSMISNAITRAQEKIEAKMSVDLAARSQSEWLSKNLPV